MRLGRSEKVAESDRGQHYVTDIRTVSTEQETDLLTTLLQLRLDMLVRLQGENIFFLENIFIVPPKSSVLNYHNQ